MNSIIVGVDPGTSGGMAWIDSAGDVQTCIMGKRREFIVYAWEKHVKGWKITVYMEKVAGYYPKPKVPVPGEKPEYNLQASSFAMFNFGKSAGICLGICEAFNIVPIEVVPRVWQSALFVKKWGTRSQWKNELKAIAQRRFPDVSVTLANADALLILSYGMLMTKGEIHVAPDKKVMK